MEQERLTVETPRITHAARLKPQQDPIFNSVATEAALSELKRQAPTGCVLCSLDLWDEEEWD